METLTMTLNRRQELELKAADGLLSEEERQELGSFDVSEVMALREQLVMALRPPSFPSVVDGVMQEVAPQEHALGGALRQAIEDEMGRPAGADAVLEQVSLTDVWPTVRAALKDALAPPRTGSVADDVVAALQLEEDDHLGEQLRQALAHEPPGSVADAVMATVLAEQQNLDAVGPALAEAVRSEAGAPPLLWEAVAAGIEAEWDGHAEALRSATLDEAGTPGLTDSIMAAITADAEQQVIPLHREPAAADIVPANTGWFRRFVPPAVMMAAAAALVLFVVPSANHVMVDYELATVNNVVIEDMYTETDAMVQVLTFDEDAPPIIFIEEGASL